MPEEIKPLSPQEVDAVAWDLLNLDTLLERRLVLTVRGRERQRDDLDVELKAAWESRDYTCAIYHQMREERDELQRQLAGARQALTVISEWSPSYPANQNIERIRTYARDAARITGQEEKKDA
jgi:hypothetical protein